MEHRRFTRRHRHSLDHGNERKWNALRKQLVVGQPVTVYFRNVAHEADVSPHSVYVFVHRIVSKFAKVELINSETTASVEISRWPSKSELSDHTQKRAATTELEVEPSNNVSLIDRLRAYRTMERMAEQYGLEVVADEELDAIIAAATADVS